MKASKSRRLIAAILSSILVLTLTTGCGSQNSTNETPTPPADTASYTPSQTETPKSTETVTLDFWHHYSAQSPENKTLTEVIIPKFESENPGIKVKAVPHEWDELHKKILISANSGQLPDVARSDIAWVPEFQKMNILVALDKEISDFEAVKNSLMEGPMATAKVKDNYYGLALNTNTKILFYNKALFDKKGLAVPTTFDQFFETASKLTYKDGGKQIWGYGEPALSGWNICPFIWSNGGDITDPTYTKASGYINSDKSIEIIQKLADLYKSGAMAGFNNGDIPLTDGFGTGRYAMIIEGPWKFAELAGAYPDFEVTTSQMPAGSGGSAQVLGGEDIVMFNTARKEAAWEFMKFMTSDFAQINMAKCGQIPVCKSAIESDEVKAIKNFEPFLAAIKTAKPRPPVSTWPEIDNELTMAVTKAIKGEVPVKQAMDELAVKIDALLAAQ